jgi:ribose transport system substrate-binding protein
VESTSGRRVSRWLVAAIAAMLMIGWASGMAGGATRAHVVRGAKKKPQLGYLAQINKQLALDYAGTDRPLPKTGPKAVTGKSVWVISCTQAGAGCALPSEAAVAAGKAIGWNMTLVDGKYDPAVWNEQIRAAVAAKADAIILVSFDCPAVQGSLAAAKSAGVKIYGLYALDCDDVGGQKMFDGTISYGKLGSYSHYIETQYAKAIGTYAIAKLKGNARAIELRSDDLLIVKHISNGFEKQFATCKTCKLYKKTFTGADFLGGKLQAFTAAMLTQHPDANVVVAPYDAAILLGMGAAVQQARSQGRHLLLLGGEGLPPNIDLIRKGQQTAGFGLPSGFAGWAAIDGLNRVFAGQPQVDPGMGYQTFDRGHNLPAVGAGYEGNAKSQGYVANYKRIWGVQ